MPFEGPIFTRWFC